MLNCKYSTIVRSITSPTLGFGSVPMFSADEAGTTMRESDEIRTNEQIDFDMMDLLYAL
jgi:hypothetical protein